MTETKKAVCLPLSKQIDLGYVSPKTWGSFELCKRQLSWYQNSAYLNKVLLVSSFSLDPYDLKYEVTIRHSDFKPGLLPTFKEKAALVERSSYKALRPEEWNSIPLQDNSERERWLKVMGLRGTKFDDLFMSQCANHANFIEPALYYLEDDEPVPYSICKTSHVCSACMEWYNIIGSSFKKKLVVPCPGSVLFAGLVTNRYYEVTHWRPEVKDDELS
ncbi:MAG: hypothetical protein ACP5U1_10630 [Desulfomonilaceae bacterium]